jgi:hypothetical protein
MESTDQKDAKKHLVPRHEIKKRIVGSYAFD